MATVDLAPAAQVRTANTPFSNEPFIDFTVAENKRSMEDALAKVAGELGREYDIIIGGRRIRTEGKITSVNAARPAVYTHQLFQGLVGRAR